MRKFIKENAAQNSKRCENERVSYSEGLNLCMNRTAKGVERRKGGSKLLRGRIS